MVVLCVVHVVVAAATAIWSYRRRGTVPAARAFAALIAVEGLWSLGHLGETLAQTLDGKIAWNAMQELPFAAVGVCSMWLGYDYVGVRRRRVVLVVFAVVAGLCAVVLTSTALHLHTYANARLIGSPPMLTYDFGALESIVTLFTLGATLVASALVLRRFVGGLGVFAAQGAALTMALALPVLSTLFAMSLGITVDGDRDVTPITFILAALIAAWGLRKRLFDVAPIARDAVLARLPDPVLVFDRDLRAIDANPAATALLGPAIGLSADELLAKFPVLVALLRGTSGEEVEVKFDGTRWFAAVATTLSDSSGLRLGRTLMLRDVTLRKQVNDELESSVELRTAELAASEGRFRALFDEVVGLVGLLDRDGRVLATNRAARAMIGDRDVRGMAFWDTPWWTHDPATQAQIRDGVTRAAGGESVRFMTHHVDGDGRRREIDFSLTPVFDATGKVVEMIPEGRDVTALYEERARAERLTAQLRQSQKLESIGRLAGGIAHDFNNLLTVIRGNAEELGDTTPSGSTGAEAVGQIIEASDAAAQITRQLLTFSRNQAVVLRPLLLGEALESTRRMLGRLLRKDIELRYELAPALWVLADPTQLQQAVLNLALNAQDAMPDGGRLDIVADATVLDAATADAIAGAKPGMCVRLTIVDTGSGIDEATRARLFEPFFTTKPEGKGTGLGLSVVHGAVYQAGGAIDVASVLGRGTTFSLYFPRVEPASAEPVAAPLIPVTPAARTIALVEDQDALRAMICRHLQRCGYRLHAFGSAAELLARAAELEPRPDLLLTDVVMPGMNGVELARKVAPLWPGTRVLFMSGYAVDVAISAMSSITDEMLISKPFRPSELTSRIERVFSTAPAWAS